MTKVWIFVVRLKYVGHFLITALDSYKFQQNYMNKSKKKDVLN